LRILHVLCVLCIKNIHTNLEEWVSIRTSVSFPTKFRLTIPSANVDLTVEAAMQEQEFISYIEILALWKGKMNVTGTVDGFPVTGNGFLEVISLFLEYVYLFTINYSIRLMLGLLLLCKAPSKILVTK
jgi:hypothetical protein